MVDDRGDGRTVGYVEDDDVDEVVDQGKGALEMLRVAQVAQQDKVALALLEILDDTVHVAHGSDLHESGGEAGHGVGQLALLVDAGRHADGMGKGEPQYIASLRRSVDAVERADDRLQEGSVLEQAEEGDSFIGRSLRHRSRAVRQQRYDLFLFVASVREKDDDPGDFFHCSRRVRGGRSVEFSILKRLTGQKIGFKLLIVNGKRAVFACNGIGRFRKKVDIFRQSGDGTVGFVGTALAEDEPFVVDVGVGGHHPLDEFEAGFVAPG